MTAPGVEKVPLAAILSTCADAASRGCEEIRAVHSKRIAGDGSVTYKSDDARDALTEADLRAQEAIVTALRAAWPGLTIVGEEDGEAAAAAAASAQLVTPTSKPLRRDLFDFGDTVSAAALEMPFVSLDDCCVFVDPLDGTREFVEGRLENVQSLVGLSVKGRATAGAIGLPFPSGEFKTDENACIVYGAPGLGVGCLGERPTAPEGTYAVKGAAKPIVETGDSSNAILGAARTVALGNSGTAHIVGGAGRKILSAAEGHCDLSIQHFNTHLWDTCAPSAISSALGGKVTDLFGSPLIHLPPPTPTGILENEQPSSFLKNSLGVVASSPGAAKEHDKLCEAMRNDPSALSILATQTGQPPKAGHAADLARGLDDAPLNVVALGKALGSGGMLNCYVAPESSAFRGMMSDGVRLELTWGRDVTITDKTPSSVFFKRIVMGELESARTKALATPFKLIRDVKSYAVEAAFLNSKACKRLASTGVAVPTAYHVDLRPDDNEPIESRFSMLLADFNPKDGWEQRGLLNEAEVKAALSSLAKMHGCFWEGSEFWSDKEAVEELEGAVWKAGAYWQPSMQPEEQFTKLGEKYEGHLKKLGDEFKAAAEEAGIEDLANLGARLQEVARGVAAASHPFDEEAAKHKTSSGLSAGGYNAYRTLVHGDPKAANCFLRDKDGGGVEAGWIDFQWCGFGLAATDVAHHLCAAADATVLSASEATLLDHYHSELCEALVGSGAAKTVEEVAETILPRSTLQSQYEDALLDMGRLVLAYQWSRANFGVEALNRNAYNKDVGSAVWIARRCEELLKARGA